MTIERKADANPTKAFFVRMITRDIRLEDCILDLIDNSVDGAWKLEGAMPMTLEDGADLSNYKIDIDVTQDKFLISDNCGGITLDDAADYAFTFGRKDSEKSEKYSIGVYGIGMKRAIFKMGSRIEVRSTYKEKNNANQSFVVPIDVTKWLSTKDWDFDIEESKELESCGVEIEVKELTESTRSAFRDPAFLLTLRRIISRDYSLHLHRGLRITLNGVSIKGWNIELRHGEGFIPMRHEYKEMIEDKPVAIEILAGMTAPPPDSTDPDESEENEQDQRYGWYVVCNGRIVLSADTTQLTGWGDMLPKWHPQYSGFIGLIFFSSEDASALPLTTTKRSIESGSDVYRRALPRMRDVTQKWIAYTNERKQAMEEAKRLEKEAKAQSIFEVQKNKSVTMPQLTQKTRIKVANIAYSMPRERVQKLAEGLGDINLTYRDVGIKSFEYAYADHVGEE